MKVSEQIIEVLDYLGEKFGIAIDWTSENVIPYVTALCQKLISYEIWTSVAWMAIMLCLSIASIIATKAMLPRFKIGIENQKSWEDGWTAARTFWCIGFAILNLATILVICTQIFDIVKCVTFPEMYVFEYVQRLITAAK